MCVYRIRNTRNRRIYVGSSTNFPRRIDRHLEQLRQKRHGNYRLQADFDAQGEDVFRFEVLEAVTDREVLLAREQHYIDTLTPYYNIARYAGLHPNFGRMPGSDTYTLLDKSSRPDNPAVNTVLAAAAVAFAVLAAWRSRPRE